MMYIDDYVGEPQIQLLRHLGDSEALLGRAVHRRMHSNLINDHGATTNDNVRVEGRTRVSKDSSLEGCMVSALRA